MNEFINFYIKVENQEFFGNILKKKLNLGNFKLKFKLSLNYNVVFSIFWSLDWVDGDGLEKLTSESSQFLTKLMLKLRMAIKTN